MVAVVAMFAVGAGRLGGGVPLGMGGVLAVIAGGAAVVARGGILAVVGAVIGGLALVTLMRLLQVPHKVLAERRDGTNHTRRRNVA